MVDEDGGEEESGFRIRSVCLASRDHYCVHPEARANVVLKGNALNGWCKSQTSKKVGGIQLIDFSV